MSDVSPPPFVLRFLRWFCPSHLYEEIEGDLIQRFHRDVKWSGEQRAKLNLILNVVRFFRPGILVRNKLNYSTNQNFMLRNYTTLIARQAAGNKTFTAINVLGLTTAIAVCLMIAQFVQFEYSFERHIKNASRTYRINLYNTQNGIFTSLSPETVPGLSYSMKQTIPGIDAIARVSYRTRAIVSNQERQLRDKEDAIVFADPSIVEVLGLDLIEGDKRNVLRDPKSLIISESVAKKYFGTTAVAGKSLDFGFNNNSIEAVRYQIKGVFSDIPANSHQHFDFVLPPENEQGWNENWAWSDVTTYVVLAPTKLPSGLEKGLSEIVKQHHQDALGDRYVLEPISDIRLHAMDGSGRAGIVNFFILLGAVVLMLAWFNYTNLSTARFFERMKEVGVRRVIGASRMHLVTQFLTESFLFNIISFALALILFFTGWQYVSRYLDQPVTVTLFNNSLAYIIVTGFIFISALCAGLYPALFLSSFKPLQSLKGVVPHFADRSTLRKVIVAVQLSVSIALVTGVIAIQRQIRFMQAQNLGISISQIMIIEEALVTEPKTVEKYELFKNEILTLSSVQGVTNASSFPGKEIDWHRTDITLGEENAAYRYNSRIIAIGTEFLDVFGVGLVSGRNFDPAVESDKKAMLISEEACKMFGFSHHDDALGKLIFIGSRRFEVIGVVKNYHYRGLQTMIEPVLYMQSYPRGPAYAVKIASGRVEETIPILKAKWEAAYAENVFRYYFLDQHFDNQYRSEQQVVTFVSGLTIIAILIACSGLFGLSLYAVNRRTKEISVRKVFGATVSNIVLLLSKDFVKLMIVAGILTVPLVYVAVIRWLNGYAYKMPVDALLLLVPVLATLFLMLFTISFQTVIAAKRNPVENMKCE